MGDLLRLPFPESVLIIAYADDVSFLVGFQTKLEIEIKACEGKAPPTASHLVFRKSDPGCCIGDSFGGGTRRFYLFRQQAASIIERASQCFNKLSKVSAASWGIRLVSTAALPMLAGVLQADLRVRGAADKSAA
ncbi:hypothetical protein EVAR_25801_1 [Eumeta japonica]|uniref:Uncharacterized protein n=1 Tax=Eumeta variegata TaxID=151549 RepID=A0A4C1VSQ5_EUMVA|nr:hypothetical protein EVAR_25801_1 [Eumeta japonica]